MHTGLGDFRKIWCIDFEFQSEGALHEEGGSQHGGRPLPLCLVAVEIRSGRLLRLWRNDLYALRRAPFDIGPDSLVCTFFGSAEFGCFIALGWSMPFNVIDLYVEHRLRMNGVSKVKGLVDVLQLNGLPHISAAVKDAHRDKILTQTQWTDIEQKQILDYCQSDVLGVVDLLKHLANWLDFPRVLLRGRYIAAVARMEWNGVPIDVAYWNRLKAAREPVLTRLVSDVDKQYGVYDGLKFREQWFSRMLARRGIPWKRTPIDGRPVLEKEYFKEQARFYGLDDLYALRETVRHLREPALAIGPDGRNRTLLSPFGTVTSRNTPSNAKFIFGPARWMRGLIRPAPGFSVAYVDWSAQEIGIAAALSGDERLLNSFLSGDPYMDFAVNIGLVPVGTSAKSPEGDKARSTCKIIFLGVNYGMSVYGLAQRLNVSPAEAVHLLKLHRAYYSVYWKWVERTLDRADLNSRISTMYGWAMRIVDDTDPKKSTKERTLMNWPTQSHGAEMMRIAAIALTEEGLKIDCPVHDAFFVEAPTTEVRQAALHTVEIMEQAGHAMFGIRFRAKPTICDWPQRYMDDKPGSAEMWARVERLLREVEESMGTKPYIVEKEGKGRGDYRGVRMG